VLEEAVIQVAARWPWQMHDLWSKKRNKRQTQKWRVINLDERLVLRERGTTTHMAFLFLIDQLPNFGRYFIMLKRVLGDD
jgi:hypothetical protein